MLAKILIVDRTSPASSYHGYTQQQQQQQQQQQHFSTFQTLGAAVSSGNI